MATKRPPLPEALRGPLRFGDPVQIEALRKYERDIDLVNRPTYTVDFNVSTIIDVQADNEDEAIEAARERIMDDLCMARVEVRKAK